MILLIVTIGLSGTQLDQDSAVGGELPGRDRWRLVLLHTNPDRWHLPAFRASLFRALLFRASLVAGVGPRTCRSIPRVSLRSGDRSDVADAAFPD